MNKPTIAIGTKVTRKWDGVEGVIIARYLLTSDLNPGRTPSATIRFTNGEFDGSGSLGWVRSNFKIAR